MCALGALIATAHRLMPHLAAVAFPDGGAMAGPPARAMPAPPGVAAGGAGQPTMLELMFAESTPLGAPPAFARNGRSNGYPLG